MNPHCSRNECVSSFKQYWERRIERIRRRLRCRTPTDEKECRTLGRGEEKGRESWGDEATVICWPTFPAPACPASLGKNLGRKARRNRRCWTKLPGVRGVLSQHRWHPRISISRTGKRYLEPGDDGRRSRQPGNPSLHGIRSSLYVFGVLERPKTIVW